MKDLVISARPEYRLTFVILLACADTKESMFGLSLDEVTSGLEMGVEIVIVRWCAMKSVWSPMYIYIYVRSV